eukprot:gene8745-9679_t
MNFLKKYFAHYLIALLVLSCQSFAENVRDYCVIGAGPAGLQMGYFLERASRDYIILERDRSAGQTNKEFNLRHDWNSLISDDESLLIKHYSKEFFPPARSMVKYLNDYATKLKLNVKYNANIRLVTKDNATEVFTLLDKNDEMYMCKTLIVSTGLWVENIPRNITGIENTVSYSKMSVNPDDYEGKTIFIIGRGNSAFETAQSLAGAANYIHMMSRERLRFAWETHYVGDVRAVNDGPIDTYQLKSLDGQFEGDIRAISFTKNKDGKIVVGSSNEDEPDNSAIREPYDTVIRCMGFRFDNSIFSKNIRPKKSAGKAKKYPAVKNNYESTVTNGMFFAGTIIHSLDWRKSAGGFIHGFRYTTRALHRILEHRNHGVKWPHLTLPNTELLNTLTKRLNEASGTYQMLNELVDVIVLSDDDHFQYFEELPKGLLPNFTEITGVAFQRGIVVNLEYGKNFSGPGSDPFKEERATGEVVEAHMSNFLHPVLYYYENPITKLNENKELPTPDRLHHIVEDFLAFWNALVHHHLPLRWFLEFATEEDLRHFYAEDCFKIAMTNKKMPYFCDEHFLKGFALSQPKPTSTITLDDSTASVPANSFDPSLLKKLEDGFYKRFEEVWPFLASFQSLSELRVQRQDLYKGMTNLGPWTQFSLNRILAKVLRRESIRVLIIGESISAGAELGCRNNQRTFHYGLASWWNKTITAATGSKLIRHQIAVGGVATNYFDRCWKEYLYDGETFDLIIWEFAFNDADAVDQCKSIERFTRSIAELENTPGLIFVSFFRKTFFDDYISKSGKDPCSEVDEEVERRHEDHEVTIAKVADYYGITLCDLEAVVCNALKTRSSSLKVQHMFRNDHPSFLAHAQMTFVLIHYLRASFENTIRDITGPTLAGRTFATDPQKRSKSSVGEPSGKKVTMVKNSIPSPLYLNVEEADMAPEPICWTAVLPNYHTKPKHDIFNLRVKHSKAFTKVEKMNWRDADEIRFDSTGGYQTSKPNQTLRIDFKVPPRPGRTHRRISVAIRNKYFGGDFEAILRSYVHSSSKNAKVAVDISTDTFDSSIKHVTGLNVYDLSSQVGPGNKSLIIKTKTGGVMLSAIIIN